MGPYGAGPSPTRTISASTPDPSGVKRIFLSQMIRAKRAGTWFGLGRLQRSLYGLAMRLDVKLQSPELLKALVSILRTLRQTLDPAGVAFEKAMRMAWVFSTSAERWGNEKAREWRNDLNYVKYLALCSESAKT